jgi:hypothetical protein
MPQAVWSAAQSPATARNPLLQNIQTTNGIPNQPPIQSATGALSPGIEADHSTTSSAEVKNEWSYNPIPPPSFYFVHLNSHVGLTMYIQGDQKVSVHLMITIQKVTSNFQSVPRQSPDIY